MKVLLFVVLVVAVVAAEQYKPPFYPSAYKPSYPASTYPSKPSYPSYTKSYDYDYAPRPYDFAWHVKDEYSYNDYAHQETSDGKGYVSGSYRTHLPDGRTQTVTYKADDYTGYVADVKYDGYAKPYDYKPAYKPAYDSYKPSYDYKPAYYPKY